MEIKINNQFVFQKINITELVNVEINDTFNISGCKLLSIKNNEIMKLDTDYSTNGTIITFLKAHNDVKVILTSIC